MALIFDIEANGFLADAHTIHSLVIYDTAAEKLYSFHNHGLLRMIHGDIEEGIEMLSKADCIVGHNIIKYDIPVIKKLYPEFTFNKSGVLDTMVLTHLIWPAIKEGDFARAEQGLLPKNKIGSYSLEAWGYRIGNYKGDYKGGFEFWSQEMQSYCEQDVMVTNTLYQRCIEKNYSPEAIELEHQVAWVMAQQERNGFCFNMKAASELYADLVKEREAIIAELQQVFPPWEVTEEFIPKSNNKSKGYVKGEVFLKRKMVQFNPGSRAQVAERLMTLRKWKPTERTESGQPKIDETILQKLPYPEAQKLAKYFLLEKRIGQLADGKESWLHHAKDGKIHGSIKTNAAVTGRATHSYPNIAQVPSCSAPYGAQCRALFYVPQGWKLVGADASGLELRCLAHFMARFDGGAYGNILLTGDIHWQNVNAAGLCKDQRDKESKVHSVIRDGCKTFIYGFLYGAGDEKIGRIIYDITMSLKNLGLPYEDLSQSFFGTSQRFGPNLLRKAGKSLKESFLQKTPALRKLRELVAVRAEKKGYILGLDGRRVHIRSPHAALNTLLQSAGALVCKKWVVMIEEALQKAGYKHGWDGDYCFCAFIHDELQLAVREEHADAIGKIMVQAIKDVGVYFNFRCPLSGEYKVGDNWAMTH